MTPHVLRTAPGIRPGARGIPRRPGPGIARGFFPAQTALLARQAGAPRAVRGSAVNVTNNLRLVNSLLVRVSLSGGAAPASAVLAVKPARLVTQALDGALRRELERELLLMERGENIAANQRRRTLLRRTLEAKPSRVVRHFYAVQMHTLSAASAGTREESFSSDIIHERRVTNQETIREQHSERVTEKVPAGSPVRDQEVSRIADQVMRQLDRRMKLQRDRSGIW